MNKPIYVRHGDKCKQRNQSALTSLLFICFFSCHFQWLYNPRHLLYYIMFSNCDHHLSSKLPGKLSDLTMKVAKSIFVLSDA